MPLSARDATPSDYEVFARLFPGLQVPDPLLTQAQFEGERMLPNVIIAEDGDRLGYAYWRSYGSTAHVVHVVVDPRAWRRGVGRLLTRPRSDCTSMLDSCSSSGAGSWLPTGRSSRRSRARRARESSSPRSKRRRGSHASTGSIPNGSPCFALGRE
jgi:hypothetical protein